MVSCRMYCNNCNKKYIFGSLDNEISDFDFAIHVHTGGCHNSPGDIFFRICSNFLDSQKMCVNIGPIVKLDVSKH